MAVGNLIQIFNDFNDFQQFCNTYIIFYNNYFFKQQVPWRLQTDN
jgi:hypothetical protein